MSEKLALHGGQPVRTNAWPKWPLFSEHDLADVEAVLRDGRMTSITGPQVRSFEEKYAAKFGVKYALATCNGVTALHLALSALGIGPGDEVIVPAHTFIGSAIPVLMANAVPVFVDVDIDTFNLDASKIEAAITDRTKAIVPVHLNGLAAEMGTILTLARKHRLFVVEDACQSHGGTYKGKLTGTMGEIGCFSFFEDKVITTGEGGMMITNDQALYDRARCVRSYGEELVTSLGERKYEHVALGFNYRMGSMNAALGINQLDRLDAMVEKRNRNAAYLRTRIQEVPGIVPPKETPGACTPITSSSAVLTVQCLTWMYSRSWKLLKPRVWLPHRVTLSRCPYRRYSRKSWVTEEQTALTAATGMAESRPSSTVHGPLPCG